MNFKFKYVVSVNECCFSKNLKSDNIREIIWSDYSTYEGDLALCVNTKHNNSIVSFYIKKYPGLNSFSSSS